MDGADTTAMEAAVTTVKKTRQPRQTKKSKVSVTDEEASNDLTTESPVQLEVTADKPVKAKVAKTKSEKAVRSKKEKKPIQVVAVVTSDGIEGTFTPEMRRPLIVHFPFNSTEVKFSDTALQYDPSPPPQVQPYDADPNYFQVNSEVSSSENQIGVELEGWRMSLEEQLKKQGPVEEVFPSTAGEKVVSSTSASASQEVAERQPTQPMPQLPMDAVKKPANYLQEKPEKAQLLKCYSVKTGETFVPPAKTEVHCFWCTHPFDGTPSFLPVKEESGVYSVYGNYCTPQCALAFLLYEHLDSHVRWERMALLHRMYRSVGRLYPSPPRESLVSYGGVYSIEKFREIISVNRVRVDVQVPPMVSILGTLDTKPIDFYDSSLQNTFSQGFSMDRFKAWSEQGGALRLKRNKPLKDHESTLDACIHISVKRGGE